jgi:hypothetical protein
MDAAMVGRTWREAKAVAGNQVCWDCFREVLCYMLEMEYNILKTANLYNAVTDTADCKINVILES